MCGEHFCIPSKLIVREALSDDSSLIFEINSKFFEKNTYLKLARNILSICIVKLVIRDRFITYSH